ncbi:DUF4148 domain-containing protein [Paraburkholderia flagellata]|uniref:DUF4148 domain-containing protein n=1 Tax=Paraburkholderia flagellata TaxID=2883241 RepID=UPI001F46C818|nr:DUF4148 domain-containing protein [Paraburkholderia flagellata]
MKTLICMALGLLIGVTLIASSDAQTTLTSSVSSVSKTRADVKAELATWRAAGLQPAGLNNNYPDDVLQAAAIVEQRRARPPADSQ